jgi:hypothetical protein
MLVAFSLQTLSASFSISWKRLSMKISGNKHKQQTWLMNHSIHVQSKLM